MHFVAAVVTAVRRMSVRCPLLLDFLGYLQHMLDAMQGGPYREKMQRAINTFCSAEQRADKQHIRRLERDMWRSFFLYHNTPNEYFRFGFERLSHAGRSQFVLSCELRDETARLTTDETRSILLNKWNAYERFRESYRRDAMKIDDHTTPEQFAEFVAKHPRFIVKPLESKGGQGVSLCDASAGGKTPGQLLAALREKNVMLEEPIVQSDALARLHPQSVNTIRCATFLKDGQVHILFTFLRIGRGDSIVDNGGSGGYVVLIDTDTGITITPGVSETLDVAIVHPDTGEQIIGRPIPRWEEMKQLAVKLSLSCPELPHIHWDLALTDGGWVIVEGNHRGGFVGPQLSAQRGYRPLLSQYFDL